MNGGGAIPADDAKEKGKKSQGKNFFSPVETMFGPKPWFTPWSGIQDEICQCQRQLGTTRERFVFQKCQLIFFFYSLHAM